MEQEQREDDNTLLRRLEVPTTFANYHDAAETETIIHLEEWKRKAYEVLDRLREDFSARGQQDARVQAEIVYYVSPFTTDEPWVLEPSRKLAAGQL